MFARGLPAWGSQRPRTKKAPQRSIIPVASGHPLTGVAAAAAAAEAEDAAAAAAAHTLVRNSYTAEMSGTHRIGSAQQSQEQRPGLVHHMPMVRKRYWPQVHDEQSSPQHQRKRSFEQSTGAGQHSSSPGKHPAKALAQQKRKQAAEQGGDAVMHRCSPDQCPGKPPTQDKHRRSAEHNKGSSSGGRKASVSQWPPPAAQHHHGKGPGAEALKGHRKPHDYMGSQYCGVNGIQHSVESLLRWRAATWDPQIKKTVYIGSFNVEEAAATAVDAWHVSHGRSPVNFPHAEVWERRPAPAEERRQTGYGSDVSQDADAFLCPSGHCTNIRSPRACLAAHTMLQCKPRCAVVSKMSLCLTCAAAFAMMCAPCQGLM